MPLFSSFLQYASTTCCPLYKEIHTLLIKTPVAEMLSINLSTSAPYVIPKSALVLFLSISFAFMQIINSALSLSFCNNLIFAALSNPGRTLAACKSSKSFPPNSKYNLSNLLILSRICSVCFCIYILLSNPVFISIPLKINSDYYLLAK